MSPKPLPRGVFHPAPALSATGQTIAWAVATKLPGESAGRIVDWRFIEAGADPQPTIDLMWVRLDKLDPIVAALRTA